MEADAPEKEINRREFIGRCTRAGLSVAAAGTLGIGLHTTTAPDGRPRQSAALQLPDYSVPAMAGRICIAHGSDRATGVRHAFGALGGMDALIQPGQRVLLKVNAAFASPPTLGATSHPELVATVARLCREAGAEEVIVSDNPINDPAACFALSGIDAAARSAGARVMLPREIFFEPYTLPGGRLIRNWPLLTGPLTKVDRVIGLAPVKDHHRSGASLTLKNWYGLLGGRRNLFHQDVHSLIAELALMIRPTAVVLDGTWSMRTNGPTGGSLSDLAPTHTMIVSTDPVAADAAGAALLGKQPADLPFIAKAEDAGAGTTDYRSLDFREIQTG